MMTSPAPDSDKVLEKAIKANPNDPFAWHLLGVRCFSRRAFSEALKCFEKAEQIKKGFSASNQYYLACCLKEMDKMEECVEVLRSAVSLPVWNDIDRKGRNFARRMFYELTTTLKEEAELEKADA